jgi:hypothetical protein
VAFLSGSTNLVIGDTNGYFDAFVRDRTSGMTERVSLDSSGGQANRNSISPSISADGHCVAFASRATNLVSGDTNGFVDVFVRERRGGVMPFCFGNGGATNCPCGNSGAPGNGCANSINASGANVTATGAASLSADSLVLAGSAMPDSSALYFQGTAQQAGGAGVTFGDGLRCAGGSVIRLGTKLNVSGASHYPDAGDQAISLRGQIATPSMRTYQVWYRNAAAYCTPSTFNLSNGLEVTWGQ